jgi:hypothetical protein
MASVWHVKLASGISSLALPLSARHAPDDRDGSQTRQADLCQCLVVDVQLLVQDGAELVARTVGVEEGRGEHGQSHGC